MPYISLLLQITRQLGHLNWLSNRISLQKGVDENLYSI